MRYILFALTTATALLTGCAGIAPTSATSAPTQIPLASLKGNVHGGQNPITGATVQVYAAGTPGSYGTGATALIPTANAGCTSTQSPTCYYLGGAPGCVAGNGQTCYTGIVTDNGGYFNIPGACLNMAKHPTLNANNNLALATRASPWTSNFIAANDLSLAIAYTGSGINVPSGVAVDASGNVWIANSAGNSVTSWRTTVLPSAAGLLPWAASPHRPRGR